jgi:phenylacetate-CoA ligase
VTPQQYAASLDGSVAVTVREAAARVPAFARRLDDAGMRPEHVGGVSDLDAIPVLSKDQLLSQQQSAPPFGGLMAEDIHVRRVFQSPGPLYEAEPDEPDPWRWAPALSAAGFRAGDRVLDAFGYHLSPAGAMFEQAAVALGCTVVPGGIGNKDLQVRAIIDLKISGYIGLPSYLKALLEAGEEQGVDPAAWPLQRAFVSAEPLPPSLRAWLTSRVPTVRQGYGTAEAGNLGYECEQQEGLHVPDDALVQVCDVDTGHALGDGATGQVVVTLLRTALPVVRFGTGDLSAFVTDPCSCGRPTPRLAGILGRLGDAVKVRGMFLHPRQIDDAMRGLHDVVAYRFVVDRRDHVDVLRCEVVAADGADAHRVRATVRERVRSALRFDAEVTLVDALTAAGVIIDKRHWD